MDYMWFEEMGLIVKPEIKKWFRTSRPKQRRTREQHHCCFLVIIAYDR